MDRRVTYLRIYEPGCSINIANVVAKLMVAGIIPISSLAAEHLLLFLRFNALCTRRDTTSGDSVLDEGIIVASSIKRDEGIIQALGFVPVNI